MLAHIRVHRLQIKENNYGIVETLNYLSKQRGTLLLFLTNMAHEFTVRVVSYGKGPSFRRPFRVLWFQADTSFDIQLLLLKIFCECIPIVLLPPDCKMLQQSFRETDMVEY